MAGALIAWPCVIGRTMITGNFWLAIACLFGSYAFGENFWSPNLQMIKKSAKPNEFGKLLGAYQFFNITAGCLTTLSVGFVANSLGWGKSVVGLGRIIAVFNSIGYLGAIFSWWRAGKLLKEKEDRE